MATMKKSHILLLCSLFTVHYSLNAQQYGWADLSANIPGSPDFSDVFFVSDDEGWMSVSSGPEIYHTTDGGANWNLLGAISSSLNNMDFASANQGYACGDNGAVFSITPQGVTNLNSGLATNLYGISSPSENEVWVCGNAGLIGHTEDGGEIWHSQINPDPDE